ncbi:MAG: hypothetical protein C0600_08735 [Ignavibacteria bacterium]|nr:MAG: hypothetical protein C0600_08735 [Ignavibacteria bacterium]
MSDPLKLGQVYHIYFPDVNRFYELTVTLVDMPLLYDQFVFELDHPSDGHLHIARMVNPQENWLFTLCSDGNYVLDPVGDEGNVPPDPNWPNVRTSYPIDVPSLDSWVEPYQIDYSLIKITFTLYADGDWKDPLCPHEAAPEDSKNPPYVAAFPATIKIPNPKNSGDKKIEKRKVRVIIREV